MAVRADTEGSGFARRFIRQDISPFQVPSYRGRRYEALVPDTLDIQQRCRLAVNGLTGATDPEKDYMLYFGVNFRSKPPSMHHGNSDNNQAKFMESLPLMRIAGGSDLNDRVDPFWMATALRMIGPDGLAYWPSLPWAKFPVWAVPCVKNKKHYSVPFICGRLIGAMTLYMLRDPDGPWKDEMENLVEGLRSIAVEEDDYAFFPQGGFAPGVKRVRKAEKPIGIWSSLVGWTIQGLAQFHRVSAYEPAIDLAEKLARYLIHHGKYYGPNGEFLPNYAGPEKPEDTAGRSGNRQSGAQRFEPGPPPVNNLIHFQHHMVPLLGLLDHALAVNDQNMVDFVRCSFEWAGTKGDILVGYFPEHIDNVKELETSELCEVAGMIGLALKLSSSGAGDYWDDADRWIRNQFAEGQLQRTDWIHYLAEGGTVTRSSRILSSQIDPVTATCDRVPERNIGAFAGWPSANDWFAGYGSGIMACCTGNATRALYYIWEHMQTYEKGALSVNLLLNRPSRWADVHSHLPYRGQVDIEVKTGVKEIKLRLPEWVREGEARGQRVLHLSGFREETGNRYPIRSLPADHPGKRGCRYLPPWKIFPPLPEGLLQGR